MTEAVSMPRSRRWLVLPTSSFCSYRRKGTALLGGQWGIVSFILSYTDGHTNLGTYSLYVPYSKDQQNRKTLIFLYPKCLSA